MILDLISSRSRIVSYRLVQFSSLKVSPKNRRCLQYTGLNAEKARPKNSSLGQVFSKAQFRLKIQISTKIGNFFIKNFRLYNQNLCSKQAQRQVLVGQGSKKSSSFYLYTRIIEEKQFEIYSDQQFEAKLDIESSEFIVLEKSSDFL